MRNGDTNNIPLEGILVSLHMPSGNSTLVRLLLVRPREDFNG